MGSAALIAMLKPGAAVAEPIIVIISSQHNLEYARRACSSVANPEGIAECKFVGDGRNLGRKLEIHDLCRQPLPDPARLDEVESKLARMRKELRMMHELQTPTAIGYSARRGNLPRKDN
jgi:hypothetical protein